MNVFEPVREGEVCALWGEVDVWWQSINIDLIEARW